MDLLAALGLLFIVKDSTILRRPREWAKSLHPLLRTLLECPQCLGFWCGLAVGGLHSLHGGAALGTALVGAVLCALSTSLLGMFANYLLDILDEHLFRLRKK